MTVAQRQTELIEDLLIIEDVQERLSAVVTRAARRSLPVEQKLDANRVHGCVSSVWLTCERSGEALHFQSDAESPMVKGLVALLCDVYDGGVAAEVIGTEPDLWDQLGFLKMLTPTRLNGLSAVRARIKECAVSSLVAASE